MRGFRVWSNYWKKYAAEAELYMDGSVDAVFEDDGGVPHHENTDLVVEFKTGLKDKNGKEICKGDIVSIYKGSKIFAVEQNRGRWEIGLDSLYLWQDYCEVIGNIHENTELLKEEE